MVQITDKIPEQIVEKIPEQVVDKIPEQVVDKIPDQSPIKITLQSPYKAEHHLWPLAIAGLAVAGMGLALWITWQQGTPTFTPTTEAIKKNWEKAVSFDANLDGVVY